MSVTIKMEPVHMDEGPTNVANVVSPGLKQTKSRQRPSGGDTELMRCKRRIHFGVAAAASAGFPLSPAQASQPPAAVARRNERERNRVRMVNLGFNTLRQHVPNGAKNKKMSKVETLKSAVEYIRQLQQLLQEQEGGSDNLRMQAGNENVFPARTNGNYPVGSSSSTSSSVQSPTYSVASSPTPSWNSDASSPYDSYSPAEEEELMDFAAWFS